VAGFEQDSGARRRFPALDPEPPPPPWWRRLVIPAALLVLADAVAAVVQLNPFSSTATHQVAPRAGHPTQGQLAGPRIQAPGRIVAITPAGALVLANPDGSHLTRVHGLGNVGQHLTLSPDARYPALFNGQLVSIRQGPALLTAAENIEVAPRALGRPPTAARAALADVGLDGHAGQLVGGLSGGQQQRVAVARALALQPRLLIVDEPTAELDPASRAVVLARIFEVTAHGGALVMATHDPEVAERCDRILDLRVAAGSLS
jgi:hypothetical protein